MVDNLWLGDSVENSTIKDAIDYYPLQTAAANKRHVAKMERKYMIP